MHLERQQLQLWRKTAKQSRLKWLSTECTVYLMINLCRCGWRECTVQAWRIIQVCYYDCLISLPCFNIFAYISTLFTELSPDQTVTQWTEASGRPKPIEVTQSPRIDPTGEIMLDLNQSLPFVKGSPIWNTLETLEVFQKMPQKPHFRPLENCKEERREGLAIGNMVTFSTLIEKVAKLKFDDPRSLFSSSLEALVDLEMHGFDIKPVQRRINELVFIKDQQEQLKGKTKEVEDQITEHTHEKTKIDEEIYEIDKKMIVLQEKRAVAMAKKESKDSDIAALLSSVDAMNESIQTGRQDFERLATSPW